MMLQKLDIGNIRIDGGTQSREKINEGHVTELAALWKQDKKLPPPVLFHDGTAYWLADGFHRYLSAQRAEHKTLLCEVHSGTQRDAILFSVGANHTHGLKRTNADKRKAVKTLLSDPEWSEWSSHRISDTAGVSHVFVEELRNQLVTVTSSNPENPETPAPETRIGKDGKRRPAKRKAADPAKAAAREKAKAEKAKLRQEKADARAKAKADKEKAKADAKAAKEEARTADTIRRNGQLTVKGREIDEDTVTKAFGSVVRLIDKQADDCGMQHTAGHRAATDKLGAALEAYKQFTTECRRAIGRK